MSNYDSALKIVNRLRANGRIAYFAGGWVRDYIMKHPSDDIDIATDAEVQEILELFPKTLHVGIQFGVVIVLMDGHPFEVATFRKDVEYKDGRKPERIEPASPQIDAERRDFTINGMFYDPVESKIYDYVGGKEDIAKSVIRTIGNPYDRFFEDRLRIIRAFRFSARFNFRIDPETEQAIQGYADSLFPSVAMERVWQEFCKMAAFPNFDLALIGLHRAKVLGIIFPDLAKVHLSDLEKQVMPIRNYPKNIPETFFLRELFPQMSIDKVLEMGKYLKAPNKGLDQLKFYMENEPFDIRLADYPSVKFYSNPDAGMCLKVYAARLSDPGAFLKEHEEKKRG